MVQRLVTYGTHLINRRCMCGPRLIWQSCNKCTSANDYVQGTCTCTPLIFKTSWFGHTVNYKNLRIRKLFYFNNKMQLFVISGVRRKFTKWLCTYKVHPRVHRWSWKLYANWKFHVPGRVIQMGKVADYIYIYTCTRQRSEGFWRNWLID